MKCNRERALFQNEPTLFRTHLNPTAASLSRQGAKRRHAGLKLQQTFWPRRIHAAARPAILLFLSLVRSDSHSRCLPPLLPPSPTDHENGGFPFVARMEQSVIRVSSFTHAVASATPHATFLDSASLHPGYNSKAHPHAPYFQRSVS